MKEEIARNLSLPGFDKGEIKELIEVPKNSDMGDYSLPCFSLAKKLRKNPIEIAKEIAAKINKKNFEKVEAVNGYVNFYLDKKAIAEKTINLISRQGDKYGKSDGTGKNRKAMIEFSQTNTHKAFHVGHVRGTSLGESIARIMGFSGAGVIRANYSGDTGMHIAKWLWCYKKYHSSENIRNDEKWFADIYVDAVKRLEKSEKNQKEAEEINRKLDLRSDKELNKLWKETRKISIKSWEKIYHELNTRFDVHYFESEMETDGKRLANELVERGIAKISDKAVIMDLKEYGLGVWVLLRGDGTVLYSAKDLALAHKKFKDFKIESSLVVTDQTQDLHFRQLKKTLQLMKFKHTDLYNHLSYGQIRFPWGKISSRSGENITYSDFKKSIVELAAKEIERRYKNLETEEVYDRALAIAIAAIKYSMLKQDINRNIIFNPKEEIRFDGDTGPYLLYSYARALSILKKAEYKKAKKFSVGALEKPEEKLTGLLARFPEIVRDAGKSISPSAIAHFSYELAKTFSEFYHACPVIGSESEQFRLKLVESFAQVLKNSLWLLGINVIREM